MGGQERVALDLAGAQVRRGHEVSAVSLAPLPHGVLADEFRARGITLHSVPKGASFDLRTVARLARWLRSSRIDVVHTHNPQPLAYGAPAGRLARAVVVHTKHGVNPERGRKLWLRRFGGHLADAYVAVSDATGRFAIRDLPPFAYALRATATDHGWGSGEMRVPGGDEPTIVLARERPAVHARDRERAERAQVAGARREAFRHHLGERAEHEGAIRARLELQRLVAGDGVRQRESYNGNEEQDRNHP